MNDATHAVLTKAPLSKSTFFTMREDVDQGYIMISYEQRLHYDLFNSISLQPLIHCASLTLKVQHDVKLPAQWLR